MVGVAFPPIQGLAFQIGAFGKPNLPCLTLFIELLIETDYNIFVTKRAAQNNS